MPEHPDTLIWVAGVKPALKPKDLITMKASQYDFVFFVHFVVK